MSNMNTFIESHFKFISLEITVLQINAICIAFIENIHKVLTTLNLFLPSDFCRSLETCYHTCIIINQILALEENMLSLIMETIYYIYHYWQYS